jgi:hypothetical protein
MLLPWCCECHLCRLCRLCRLYRFRRFRRSCHLPRLSPIERVVQLDGIASAMAVCVPRCEESASRYPRPGQKAYLRWSATLIVGIENENDFQVGRRIIGPAGANMKAIVASVGTGTMIRLRGVGSQHLEVIGPSGEKGELQEPLQVLISSNGYVRVFLSMCSCGRFPLCSPAACLI